MGSKSTVWYNSIVRGDVSSITIGEGTQIQEQVMIHANGLNNTEIPTIIGKNVVIGPHAILHACTVHDGAMIGSKSTVLDGATVGKGAMLAAGSILTQKKTIPDGQVREKIILSIFYGNLDMMNFLCSCGLAFQRGTFEI